MSNHFQLLVRIQEKQEVSDHELLQRFLVLYGVEKISVKSLTVMLHKNGREAKAWRKLKLGRMGTRTNGYLLAHAGEKGVGDRSPGIPCRALW